ncbi:MAG TPA: hypothetical protein VNM69_17990 [Bacillus sp. (in: firmicutes)]|nr:hypothetical protein [Bacillus sp. (in: firmicutes)]
MKYDWPTVEQYFINTNLDKKFSLKDVSKSFEIPYQTVRRYAAEHKWHTKRYRAFIKMKYGRSFEEHLHLLRNGIVN